MSGPREVRRPRLILRKSAWVTIRLAGALVYCGCSRSSSSPRKRASSGIGSHGAARGPAAGRLGVVVGVLRHPGEPHRGLRLDEVHAPRGRGRGRCRGGPSARRRRRSSRGRASTARRVVALAGRLERVVAGDPDPAAAARGRAAEVGALLDQDGVQPVLRGRERGGHPGAAGAHDDDVHLGRAGGSLMAQNCNRFYYRSRDLPGRRSRPPSTRLATGPGDPGPVRRRCAT